MNHDDEKQLRILGRLHYVAAALASIIPLLGAIYGAMGVGILLGRLPGSAPTKGAAFGWLPLGMGVLAVLFGITAVTLNLLSARCLRERKNHTLCVLTSAMNCMHFPLGSLLGTVTIIVLCRPAVRAAFGPRSAAAVAPPPARPGGTHSFTTDVAGLDGR